MSDAITTLEKLFDTLKDASNRNEAATNKLIDQQLELVTHIKTMPVEDLRIALKEHADKSTDEILDCSGTIELKTADIMESIKQLSSKVTKMILVVTVALTVATAGYFLIRYAADQSKKSGWEATHEQIEKKQQEEFDEKFDHFTDEIRLQMETLTKDDTEKKDESIHN